MTELIEPYDQFAVSAGLVERLRQSEARSSVPLQLDAAIPQPQAQTLASPAPQMTLARYSIDVLSAGAVAYWVMGPNFQYPGITTDATEVYSAVIPFFTTTHFYGFLAPLVGAYGPISGDGANVSSVRNDAIHFGAADGLSITYFPFAGFETYFSGALGYGVAEDFGWEFWLRTTQAPAGPVRLVEQSAAGVFAYLIQLAPSGAVRASRSDGTLTATVDSAQVVNDGDWHYVAVYKAGSTFAVAIDTNAAATTLDTLVGDTMLTVDGLVAGDGFVGDMDELALYPTGVTLTQRQRRVSAAGGAAVPV